MPKISKDIEGNGIEIARRRRRNRPPRSIEEITERLIEKANLLVARPSFIFILIIQILISAFGLLVTTKQLFSGLSELLK